MGETLYEIRAVVDPDEAVAAGVGPCPYCGNRPPVCCGAVPFVNCSAPRDPEAEARWWAELRAASADTPSSTESSDA